jgi:DNA polymerase-3 subunit epsilon/CBS domain-containing protein
MSLDAVALDTETTSLDARTARLVEIAVLRMRGLQISHEGRLELFVNPQCPVPASSTEIHGITEKDLRGAPEFRHVVAALDNRIGDAVVVGHNIGYDLAVIDREYGRAGLTWKVPRSLDVRALARLADPHLASYDLRALCNWLDVELYRRHRAYPDALAAAQVFIKLVPHLRGCGIRTLAEAELACRNLPGEERLYQVGGWISPAHAEAADTAPAISAVDSYPYRHRLRDVATHRPVFMDQSADIKDAARTISEPSSAGMVVVKSSNGAATFVTATDLLKASIASDTNVVTLGDIKRRSLPTVSEDEFLYRALGKMNRLNISHLGVVNRGGDITATISAADLLRHRVTSALILGDEIESARTVSDLSRAWGKLPQVVEASLREGLEPTDIAAIISAEIRVLTARATDLAEERMLASGKGRPPCAYAILVLGSAGRNDSLLSADQDNALIYKAGETDGKEDAWFAEAATHIADILHEAGIPYCEGGVMAKNPGCRHSLSIWKSVVEDWVEQAGPKDALASDIFFDSVPVAGDLALADDLLAYSYARAEAAPLFIAALAQFAKDWRPPIGIFGRLITDRDGRVDLKINGLRPMVTAARTLALKHGIRLTSTIERLAELKARSLIDSGLGERALSAFAVIVRSVLGQQISDSHRGIRLSARVDVATMGAEQRNGIVKSMRVINELIVATLER